MKTLKRWRTWLVVIALLLGAGIISAGVTTHSAHAAVQPPHLGILEGNGGAAASQHPDVINTYIQFDPSSSNFPTSFVNQAQSMGATGFVEIEPWEQTSTDNCPSNPQFPSMTTIAANGAAIKSYLNGWGTAIHNFGHPVILTFAHEFNIGGQYPWAEGDCEGTTPAQWVAAWKVVHDDVNATAGGLAEWMWAPNVWAGGSNQHVAAYWPGASYADMTGVDGYAGFVENGTSFPNTFNTTFGETFNEIKALPGFNTIPDQEIWISETNLQDLGSGSFDSITKFINDDFAAGGGGFLEFEDGLPQMSAAQWTEANAALAANEGSAPTPTPTPTTPTPTPTTPTPTPTPTCTASVPTAVPPNIAAAVRGSWVQISWGSLAGATNYEIHINLPSNVLYKDVKNPGNSVTFSPVPTTGHYKYSVRALNCAGNGPWSAVLTFAVTS